MNGEIIPLANCMNIMFEVSDLKRLSPAVIGRCGTIVMESKLLGWKALKASFMTLFPSEIYDDEKLTCVGDMYDWLVPPCLKQIQVKIFF